MCQKQLSPMGSSLIITDIGCLPVESIDCVLLDYCAKINERVRSDFQNSTLMAFVNPFFHKSNINTSKIIKVNFSTTPVCNQKLTAA